MHPTYIISDRITKAHEIAPATTQQKGAGWDIGWDMEISAMQAAENIGKNHAMRYKIIILNCPISPHSTIAQHPPADSKAAEIIKKTLIYMIYPYSMKPHQIARLGGIKRG